MKSRKALEKNKREEEKHEENELNLEQPGKVTGGVEKRKYTTEPQFARPEDAINDVGPDARMEEVEIPEPVPVPVPVPDPSQSTRAPGQKKRK